MGGARLYWSAMYMIHCHVKTTMQQDPLSFIRFSSLQKGTNVNKGWGAWVAAHQPASGFDNMAAATSCVQVSQFAGTHSCALKFGSLSVICILLVEGPSVNQHNAGFLLGNQIRYHPVVACDTAAHQVPSFAELTKSQKSKANAMH